MLLNTAVMLENLVAAMVTSAFVSFWLVCQMLLFPCQTDLAILIHASVTSRLVYSSVLCVGLPLKSVLKLQLMQNAVARVLFGARIRICNLSITAAPLASDLFLNQICVVLTFKALCGVGPGYLKGHLLPYIPTWVLRSQEEALLTVRSMR